MRTLILTILAVAVMLIPTTGVLAADFWTGTATMTVVDPIQVYSNADLAPNHLLPTGQTYNVPTNPILGVSQTVQLWVKNNSTSADYTVTPTIVGTDMTAFTITGATPLVVNRSGSNAFTFVVTPVKTGTYSLTLNLSHN